MSGPKESSGVTTAYKSSRRQNLKSCESNRSLPRRPYKYLFASVLVLFALFSTGVVSAQKYIALTDQKPGDPRILVMDYEQKDWSANNPKAIVWSWRPSDSDIDPVGWRLPTEAKLRNNPVWGGQWVAISDSYGFMAVVSYPGKEKKWSVNAGQSANVHGIELLPNGNVAAAASAGGWVRVYAASQGPSSSHFVQYNLPDAHSVLWDPQWKVLWALGRNKLVKLHIGGTDAEPTLTVVATTTLAVDGGHDVEPNYGDPSRLWIAAGNSTWLYNKMTNKATLFQSVAFKSINNQPMTHQVVETRPHTSCKADDWCTDVFEFFSPDDIRVRPGAAVYRARIWNPEYQ